MQPSQPSAVTDEATAELPVVVIGAGPVGLAAAAQLAERNVAFRVFESGASAGAAVAEWGHTRLFSPWRYVVDEAAARLLDRAGWLAPKADRAPYGRELVMAYLEPLAATPALAPHIFYGATVTAVSRRGMDRTRTNGRTDAPFVIRVLKDGESVEHLARAVIDASGTYRTPNGVLASGLDPANLDELADHLVAALPDVLGADRDRFAGRHTLVIGAGHSAANTLIALTGLARQVPGTTVSWAIRNATPVRVYTGEDDGLPARAGLGARVAELVTAGRIELLDRFEIDAITPEVDGRVRVSGRRAGAAAAISVDTVVTSTGYRPDLAPLREIRLSLDEIVEAPLALAPLIDPNLHSCGTVSPHGIQELAHPEPNFFIVGMKSYGRAPTFLLLTGYEQVRSIADDLAGNHAAARQVQLTLPETGVCSTGDSDGSCCAAPAAGSQPIQLLSNRPLLDLVAR